MVVAVGVPPAVLAASHADQAGGGALGVAANPQAVGDGGVGERRLQRPEGFEAGHGAHRGDGRHLVRPPFRRAGGGRRAVRDRAVGSGVGAWQRGHVPGRGEPAGRLGGGDQPPRQVVDLAADLGHPHLLVTHEPEPEPARPLGHVLMDLVAGESGQPLLVLDDHHLGAVAADPLEDAVGEREEIVRRAEAHHDAAVTATPRKRQGAAPWPTCMIWLGCPFPQLTTPHTRHSEGPATASHDLQNSGVRPA